MALKAIFNGFGVNLSDLGRLQSVDLTLTNTQTKALPTTGIVLIAAPGSSKMVQLITLSLFSNTSAGAYTNINTTSAALTIAYASGYAMGAIPNDATNVGGDMATPITMLSDFLGTTTNKALVPCPFGYADSFNTGYGVLTYPFSQTDIVNSALSINIDNGGSGDLTGGNAANTLRVSALYRVI